MAWKMLQLPCVIYHRQNINYKDKIFIKWDTFTETLTQKCQQKQEKQVQSFYLCRRKIVIDNQNLCYAVRCLITLASLCIQERLPVTQQLYCKFCVSLFFKVAVFKVILDLFSCHTFQFPFIYFVTVSCSLTNLVFFSRRAKQPCSFCFEDSVCLSVIYCISFLKCRSDRPFVLVS